MRAIHSRTTVVCLSLATILASAPAVAAQTQLPEVRIEVHVVADDFATLIGRYAALRDQLQVGLPILAMTDNVADIRTAERALARRIRVARGPAQGSFFTLPVAAEIRRALLLALTPQAIASILDENPGRFAYRINGEYPKNRRLSTMPGGVLLALPELPPDLYYRFVGDYLILHDSRANIILDRMAYRLVRAPLS